MKYWNFTFMHYPGYSFAIQLKHMKYWNKCDGSTAPDADAIQLKHMKYWNLLDYFENSETPSIQLKHMKYWNSAAAVSPKTLKFNSTETYEVLKPGTARERFACRNNSTETYEVLKQIHLFLKNFWKFQFNWNIWSIETTIKINGAKKFILFNWNIWSIETGFDVIAPFFIKKFNWNIWSIETIESSHNLYLSSSIQLKHMKYWNAYLSPPWLGGGCNSTETYEVLKPHLQKL